MNKKSKILGQYLEHSTDEDELNSFLEKTAPKIGKIIQAFNSLEQYLIKIICEIINDRSDEFGLLIIHKLNYSSKVDLFNRIAPWYNSIFQRKIEFFPKLINDLNRCAKLRNAVVHADWESTEYNEYTFVRINFKNNEIKQEYYQFTEESLDKILNFIESTNELLDRYYEESHD